jgi:cytochrome c oxidase subunit 2
MLRLSATLAILLATLPAVSTGFQAGSGTPMVIHIVAERFSFTPSEITVDVGAVVELRITSEDTAHGFRLIGPGDIDVVIPKRGRGEARVTFEATEPGRFTFECSQVCGAGHNFMRGTLRVNPRRSPTAEGGTGGTPPRSAGRTS